MKISTSFVYYVALVGAVILWGWSFSLTKVALEGVHPATLTAYSFIIAGLVLFLIELVRGKSILFRIREGIYLGLALLLIELPQTIRISLTCVSNSALITGIGIMSVPFFERFIFGKMFPKTLYFLAFSSLMGILVSTNGSVGFGAGE